MSASFDPDFVARAAANACGFVRGGRGASIGHERRCPGAGGQRLGVSLLPCLPNRRHPQSDCARPISIGAQRLMLGLPLAAVLCISLAGTPAVLGQSDGSNVGIGVVDDEPIVLKKVQRPALPFGGEPDKAFIIAQREYEKQIRRIRARYLGHKRYQPGRERGLEELSRFTQPAAIMPLLEVLRDEQDDVRTWLLDHLADVVDPQYGRPTLTWLSIYDEDEAFRDAARARLVRERPGDRSEIGSSWIIARALQSPDHKVANMAGLAADGIGLVEAIPLLITAQAATGTTVGETPSGTGDLAWIQLGTSRYFVSDLTPVVGTNSAGFDPELSVLREGSVVAIEDAMVTTYRTYVHDALVSLVEDDFGQTVDFGYDVDRWKRWYGEVYIPQKQQEARLARQHEAQARQSALPSASAAQDANADADAGADKPSKQSDTTIDPSDTSNGADGGAESKADDGSRDDSSGG